MTIPANRIAFGCAGLLLLASYAGASQTQGWGLLTLVPPGGDTPDTGTHNEFYLYLAAYTAWATVLLLVPVYALVWRRRNSERAWQWWRSFWAASAISYLVHLGVSAFGFFGGDFAWMTSSSRVSAFWPGMALALWWPLDAAIVYLKPETRIHTLQRMALHLATFVLFIGGSLVKGELPAIRILGAVLLLVTVLAAVRWLQMRRGYQL